MLVRAYRAAADDRAYPRVDNPLLGQEIDVQAAARAVLEHITAQQLA